MKLDHKTVVTNDGKKVITSTWSTDSGKPSSQTVTTSDLKTGKTTVTRVSGGKLIP